MDGAIIANNTVSAEFQKRYFARFGNKSQITFAAYAFDFGNLLKKYLDTPERESKDILAGLLEIHPEEGACGRIFLVQGEGVGSGFSYSVSLKKLENSEFQNLP